MKKIGILIVTAIASFSLGRYVEKTFDVSTFEEEKIHAERTFSGSGNLINPLLECEISTFGSNQKYIPFESDTKKRINSEVISKNPDLEISLYFRNLRNGPWFGINETNDFAPASLMKLPVAIAYMKWSEYLPSIKDASFSGVVDSENSQNIPPNKSVEAGKSYTLDELISMSLAYSDNNANSTLTNSLPKDIIYKVFTDLNLPIIDQLEAGKDDYISVKEYASFFRVLYNASYLSDINSSYLLNILTNSVMNAGIQSPLPRDVLVANKFGERRIPNLDGITYTSQFHDCGIVYYEPYPYILCVMTKGDDNIRRLEGVVSDSSKIIFDEIKKRYP